MSRSIWTNDVDYIIAESQDEAHRILCRHYGTALVDDFDRDDLRAVVAEGDFSVGCEDDRAANETVSDLMRAGPLPDALFGMADPVRIERGGSSPWPLRVVADIRLWSLLPSGYLACTEY